MTHTPSDWQSPLNSDEILPPGGCRISNLPIHPLFLPKKNTNVSKTPIAPAPSSADRISVSTRVQVLPVREARNVPSESASRVRAEKAAGVLHSMFPTARARVSTRVIRTDALRRLRRAQEAEPTIPVPVRVHPAARGRSAREVHVRTVPPTNPATVLRVRKQTDPADVRRLRAPAIQTVARGNSVPMPGRPLRTAIIARQIRNVHVPADSYRMARADV